MTTLADKYPEAHANIRQRGYVHVAALMERFGRGVELDSALGMSNVTSAWCTQKAVPSARSEKAAKDFICSTQKVPDTSAPIPAITIEHAAPDMPATLMVVCAADRAAKAVKVLELLGCEVVEV